ncbi:MAG: NnrU family protein [Anaerolineales bacterium]|jgi:protein-S-isoprenylcysteine O-methyltransferase Ste14
MIPWINLIVMVISLAACVWLYIKSAGPAALEKKIGPSAYKRCGVYRAIAMLFMFVVMANFILYYYYPLPGLPQYLPWPRWISIVIAVVLAIPAAYLVVKGSFDAGKETAVPQKDGEMYGGIYERIRHPQAWEAVFWFVIAFGLHSPFLVLISILWVPLEYWMVRAEEKDLVIRYGKAYEDYMENVGMFWPKRKRGA